MPFRPAQVSNLARHAAGRAILIAGASALLAGASGWADPPRFDIVKYGAVGDGTTLNTRAIQSAIDQCAQKGGGTLVVPQGEFLSGALFLRPGVNVELLKGAVLMGSREIKDYPKAITRIEGHFEPWPAALLNADKADHLRISGPGTLDGSGQVYWQEFLNRRKQIHNTTNLSVERPRLAFIRNSEDVRLTGLNFRNSGFWNLHLYRCQNVTVDGCRFEAPVAPATGRAPSTDGIDVDSSQDVTISRCFFAVGDDCIALKGSKGPFAMHDQDSPPVERIHILDCIFQAGGGIVTAGSEATVVRDVDVQRCTTRRVSVLRLKLRGDTPQLYENISFRDITLEGAGAIFNISPWSQYFDLQGQPPPKSTVRDITLAGIKGKGGSFGKIIGNAGTTFGAITVKDANVELKNRKIDFSAVPQLRFENVVVNGAPASP